MPGAAVGAMLCTLGTGHLWKRTIRLGRSLLEPWPVGGRAVRPGEVVAGRGDEVLRTVVGGGLVVVLMDARREVAVVTHTRVPASAAAVPAGAGQVETVLALALQTAVEQGARPGFIRGKLFGAALGLQPGVADGRSVVGQAEHFLSDRGIAVDEMDVGGREYRQVAIRPSGGAVWADSVGAPPRPGATAASDAPGDAVLDLAG